MSERKPDVGIVMPVYKQRRSYLHQAITSILNQSYRHFKFVIMVDGRTGSVMEQIWQSIGNDPRVIVLSRSQNKGIARSLNRGFQYLMKIPSIRYLTWVSSDNIHRPEMIQVLRQTLRSSPPEVGLVYGSYERIGSNGKPLYSDFSAKKLMEYQNQPQENLLDSCFIGAAFLYRKRYAKLAGGYELEPVEDYDYWLKITEHCKIKFIPLQLADYRVNSPHSVSRQLQQTENDHLRYRNAFQTARYRARQRRKIPLALSVILPFHPDPLKIQSDLNEIFEQHYGNFELLLISRGAPFHPDPNDLLFQDPRIRNIHHSFEPSISWDQAVKIARTHATGKLMLPIQHFRNRDHYELQKFVQKGESPPF